jgi:hypothetical protein
VSFCTKPFPRRREAFLRNITVDQLIKKFPSFCETCRFITEFTILKPGAGIAIGSGWTAEGSDFESR